MAMEKFPKIDNKGAPSNSLVEQFIAGLCGHGPAKPDDHEHEHARMADEGCPNND
jgi:hypothetical protein